MSSNAGSGSGLPTIKPTLRRTLRRVSLGRVLVRGSPVTQPEASMPRLLVTRKQCPVTVGLTKRDVSPSHDDSITAPPSLHGSGPGLLPLARNADRRDLYVDPRTVFAFQRALN